ncbi:MAG TPA: CpsD/CapB family tyrosine-protein kinase [Patescibacteria group bacterium]|nr:CpsD/CapB family tyrosine-protein kinase [Patescibacteria group bacterium]
MSKIFDALRKAEREKERGRGEERPREAVDAGAADREEMVVRGIGENFRRSLLSLRNSIDSEMKQKNSRIVMFTSAVSGEGKTTIVAYLARMLASSGSEKVLLVDCSVLHPQLHDLFGQSNDAGLVDYLSGGVEINAIVKPIEAGVFDLVTVGTSRRDDVTQPFFNSERMRLFCKQAGERYDYVLVDTSAILEAPETSIIGSYMDGVVLVIYAGRTKREVLKRAMGMVEKLDGKFIGSVLNKKKYYIPEFIYRRV